MGIPERNDPSGPRLASAGFEAFLGAVQRVERVPSLSEVSRPESVASVPPTSRGDDLATSVLKALFQSGPQSLEALRRRTGSGLTELLNTLDGLKRYDLVNDGSPGRLIELTEAGSEMAKSLMGDV